MSSENAVAYALIDLICFLEFSDDVEIDPDLAVAQMEQAAAILQSGNEQAIKGFLLACQAYADKISATNEERSQFIRSLPEALGLTD